MYKNKGRRRVFAPDLLAALSAGGIAAGFPDRHRSRATRNSATNSSQNPGI
jgi:hypothetical protein